MATKKNEVVTLKPIALQSVNVRIVGDSPLIVHKWSFKSLRELVNKGETIGKKIPRNPFAEVAASLYWMDAERDPFPFSAEMVTDPEATEYNALINKYAAYTEEDFLRDIEGARFGFPVTAIKAAGISSIYRNGMYKNKVDLQSGFFVRGEGEQQLGEIKFDGCVGIRQDTVRVGMGTADMRYRPVFENWSMDLKIQFDKNARFKLTDIVNIINRGGYFNGIGEWRLEKGGQFGAYHVE